MKLQENYLSDRDFKAMSISDQGKETRAILSDDAYAICDLIETLINKIEHARLSMVK